MAIHVIFLTPPDASRKVHGDYTKAAQALDVEYYPDTPTGSKGPIETPVLRDYTKAAQALDVPSATHPRAHEVSGFGVGAFGELSAECSELWSFVARVQAASYVAYYGDKTPSETVDAQCLRIRCFSGLTTQVRCARLIVVERRSRAVHRVRLFGRPDRRARSRPPRWIKALKPSATGTLAVLTSPGRS